VLLHYDGSGVEMKRIEKEPETAIAKDCIEIIRKYWEENKKIIPSGFSMAYGHGYELATKEDAEAFYSWFDKHRPER